MKKLYLSFSLLSFAAAGVIAQPTLTGANTNPVVGENFLVHSIPYTSPGNAGANLTWNFASVASTGTSTVSYVNPSSTPNGSSFPGATVALSSGGYYDYYSATSTSYSRVGNTNGTTNIPYSDPEMLFSYPVSYGSNTSDNLYSSYTSNSVPLTRSGTTTSTADGYGTLILPYGTITNVMRVKWIQNYSDYYQSSPLYTYAVTIYVWYKPGIHYPLMSLTSISINSGAPTEYGSYLDASAVGIEDNEMAKSLSVFPNPSSDVINVNFSMENSADVKYTVHNMLGETVITSREEATAGTVSRTIDVSALAAGMYMLRIETGEAIITRKITVR